MRIHAIASLAALLLASAPRRGSPQNASASAEKPPIQDNSFLIEEAYNQERRVVQHIGTFSASRGSSAWLFTFTQEWPVGGRRHQLSYVVPLVHADPDAAVGIGDAVINYRRQLDLGARSRIAAAPRLSVLLPTGSYRRGLGVGGVGVQVNLPVSVELPFGLVAHSNAGATFTPSAREKLGRGAAASSFALGQSLVWLTAPSLNLMLEALWTRAQQVEGTGRTRWGELAVVAPGIRGAIDFRSGLQVVPGISFPVGIGARRGQRSLFLYLSFEHAFGRERE